MKKIILLCLICGLMILNLKASGPQAFLNYAIFNLPGEQPYIETYIGVNTLSLRPVKNDKENYQTMASISMVFRKGDEIKYIDKYDLLSPEEKDSLNFKYNMLDQKRISLPPGNYLLELNISDKNNPAKEIRVNEPIRVYFPSDSISISDIALVESYKKTEVATAFSKNGIEMVPMIDNYYPTNLNSISFYAEIYNADKVLAQQSFLVSYSIEDFNTGQKISRFSKYNKQDARSINVLLAEFPIEKLSTGNYNILIEVTDREGNIISSKRAFFQRNNKAYTEQLGELSEVNIDNSFVNIYTQDELAEHIRSLGPISSITEKKYSNTVLENKDLQNMRKYFVFFWEKRNITDPEKAWREYSEEVRKVNKAYSTRLYKGYDTERGRVYLQYGPPTMINENKNDPSLYPYEIWHYNRLKNQSNKKFVFVNKDLVTNDYTLLHSDAIGEINNNRWQSELNSRAGNQRSIDPDERIPVNSNFGSKLREDFK